MFNRRQSMPVGPGESSKSAAKLRSKPRSISQVYKNYLEFLQSDIWLIPINDFEERNSIVFDREQGDPTVYYQVHKEFADLVNNIMQCYCQDVGIEMGELSTALKSGHNQPFSTKGEPSRERILLEPIVSAENFNVFVPMMMRKNIELQLQALKVMEHIRGLLPSSLKLADEDAEVWKVLFDEDESERLILVQVLRQSKQEWEHDQRLRDELQRQLDTATEASVNEKKMLEAMIRSEQRRMEEAMQTAKSCPVLIVGQPTNKIGVQVDDKFVHLQLQSGDECGTRSVSGKTPTHGDESAGKYANAVVTTSAQESKPGSSRQPRSRTPSSKEDVSKKRMSLGNVRTLMNIPPFKEGELGEPEHYPGYGYRSLLKEREGVPEEWMKNRTTYLREHRDRLMAMKRKEREKQLKELTKTAGHERPRTAKAARGALSRGSMSESGDPSLELERRREIAAKIKSEVINYANNK